MIGSVWAWPVASKTNASWPAHRLGGREKWFVDGRKKRETKWFFSSFSQRVPVHVPSPPSRWAGRYQRDKERAAGRVSHKKYSLPPHNPTREGSPEGRTSSLWGSFPHFFPRNGAPAGQATVPCRSNGARGTPTGTRASTPGTCSVPRLMLQGNKKSPRRICRGAIRKRKHFFRDGMAFKVMPFPLLSVPPAG